MLILEGADMLGKTTFCNALLKTHSGLDHRKCGLPEAELVGAEPWQKMIHANTVCDRFAMSEFIYGLLCRGKSNLTPQEWNQLLEETALRGVKWLVWVCPPEEYLHILAQRYDARREAFSMELCAKVNQAYWQLLFLGQWNGYRLPTAVHPVIVNARHGVIKQEWPAEQAATWAADYSMRLLLEANPSLHAQE